MAFGLRGKSKSDGPGTAGRLIGNVLLLLATLGVFALAGYLVLYPPGVLDPAQAEPPAPLSTPATTTPAASGATSAPPTQVSMAEACGLAIPLLDQTNEIAGTAVDGLDPAEVATLTTNLTSAREVAPEALATALDPLVTLVTDFNTALAGGSTDPLGDDAVAALDGPIRDQCP